jgi:hypothetical protein
VQLALEPLDLGLLLRRLLLQPAGHLGLGQGNGGALLVLGQAQPLLQRLLEAVVAHLLQDLGIASLVDGEGLVAVGADDLVHGGDMITGYATS